MNYAIIVAAGKGLRLGGVLRKQYRPLAGVPILGRTLSTFVKSGRFDEIVVVAAADEMDACQRRVIAPFKLSTGVRLVAGGRERQASVFNGLEACRGGDDDLVLIHDGVRPLVTEDLLGQCLAAAQQNGACIAAVPAFDTLKQGLPDGRIEKTLVRDAVWLAQTPQGFRLGLIRAAHRQAREERFVGTDDAQLLERMGHPVFIVPGSRANIKITHPDDLLLAEAIWRQRHI
ncbi:MAG: 2-C-methyl-D-erythritol 4-phosphate cytidylyltransferase [Desulfosarcina sp.]|nr:2-C-methyl-D-erythritol 4-phosphate cytidylyltransferase [Desulfobacterales bacterium]